MIFHWLFSIDKGESIFRVRRWKKSVKSRRIRSDSNQLSLTYTIHSLCLLILNISSVATTVKRLAKKRLWIGIMRKERIATVKIQSLFAVVGNERFQVWAAIVKIQSSDSAPFSFYILAFRPIEYDSSSNK